MTGAVALGVFSAALGSLGLEVGFGGDEASGAVVRTWAGAEGDLYADVVFDTYRPRRVRASIKEDRWVDMPKAGEQVRVWYQLARPRSSARDARRPGPGVPWQAHAVTWLINAAVFGTMGYRTYREERAKRTDPGDLVIPRSPKDAPPLDR